MNTIIYRSFIYYGLYLLLIEVYRNLHIFTYINHFHFIRLLPVDEIFLNMLNYVKAIVNCNTWV